MKNRHKMSVIKNLWVAKPLMSVIILLLTIRYAFPISDFLSCNMELLISDIGITEADIQIHKTNSNYTQGKESILQEETLSSENTTDTASSDTQDAEPTSILTYETPDDILQFEQEYLATYSDCTPYGKVEEVFFKTSGATDTVQGIHIKNATATKKPDFDALLNTGPTLDINDKSDPVILIFHTHTTESYLMSDNGIFYKEYETRSTDNSKNMVRIGEEICKVLKHNGIGYIHDKTIYDESYDGAYSRSREAVKKYLEEYPSIQIVIDVHRDAIYYSDTSHCKPTAVINEKKAAQIMIITGAEEGYITDFPNWENNLKFALCFQQTAENSFEGLMKPLYFCQRKYNMDLSACSILLEIGTNANTLDEAMYSGFLTGIVLSEIINDYSKGQ